MGEEAGRGLLTVVSTDGWRSAGDLGSWDQAEVKPYERTASAPPRSDRKRDRSEEGRRFFRRGPEIARLPAFARNIPPDWRLM